MHQVLKHYPQFGRVKCIVTDAVVNLQLLTHSCSLTAAVYVPEQLP
jgi:hypothetical protein